MDRGAPLATPLDWHRRRSEWAARGDGRLVADWVSQAIASRFLPSTRTGCLHKSYQFHAPPNLISLPTRSVSGLGGSMIDLQRVKEKRLSVAVLPPFPTQQRWTHYQMRDISSPSISPPPSHPFSSLVSMWPSRPRLSINPPSRDRARKIKHRAVTTHLRGAWLSLGTSSASSSQPPTTSHHRPYCRCRGLDLASGERSSFIIYVPKGIRSLHRPCPPAIFFAGSHSWIATVPCIIHGKEDQHR
ncbi:hypothetical protein ElyMa_000261700 [Elysia marginata]|uniref:Uncharacterized protein n=1 Tax=Elysia marginata TaxID=1093978 RepID=A0AAV4F4F4_9GAST|nr:hypothetical protein ElyMa_000261700 [Elysia marginata]